LNSTIHSRAKAGRRRGTAVAALLAAVFTFTGISPARAQSSSTAYWFSGTRLLFDDVQQRSGEPAVGTSDSGLARFLTKLGATLSYQPGQKYIVVTSADRRTIAFTLGDLRYAVGGVAETAAFAPYAANGVVYLPLLELARALYVDPVEDGGATVLEPQLGVLEVHPSARLTVVTLRGATPLQFKRLSDDGDDDVVLAFAGTASTLESNRTIDGAALRGVSIAVSGSPRNPTTVVHLIGAQNNSHALFASDSPNAIVLAFAPAGVAVGGVPVPLQVRAPAPVAAATVPLSRTPRQNAVAAPLAAPVEPLPSPSASGTPPDQQAPSEPTADTLPTATITSFVEQPGDRTFTLRVNFVGALTYEWHRLSDNRWYVDLKPAALVVEPADETLDDPTVTGLRIKSFIGPTDHLPTVRIALTLTSPRTVELDPSSAGVTIVAGAYDDTNGLRSDVGEIADGRLVTAIVPLPPPPSPVAEVTPNPQSTWKFTPPAGNNSRLIVIDPGHGGSDFGAMHNGLVEKELNLDIARRLRAILVARGWQVKMTRDSDVDVYQPNDSAHDELQARCDIANNAGARLFISVHSNSYTDGSQSGTTTYYFTPESYRLAQAVHERLAGSLPTKDDGIIKNNFYVIHHTKMPSVLIETAFLSNAADAELLHSSAFLQKIAAGIAAGVGDYTSGGPPLSSNGDANDMDGN